MIVFSGSLDKIIAAFIIATGAAAMGTLIMKGLMKKKGVLSLNDMLEIDEESDVRIFICEMSMDLMGMQPEEMVDYKNLEYCGVAKFLAEAHESRNILFI